MDVLRILEERKLNMGTYGPKACEGDRMNLLREIKEDYRRRLQRDELEAV